MALSTQLQEWALCRVIREADKDVHPRALQAVKTVGGGRDIAQCVFCEKEYPALVNRVRNHVAGGGVGAKEAGIAKCPGTRRREGESEADHSLREAAFKKARDLCLEANAEAAKKEGENAVVNALNLSTGGSAVDLGPNSGGMARKRKVQATLGSLTEAEPRNGQMREAPLRSV
jgi:hypothetical protein